MTDHHCEEQASTARSNVPIGHAGPFTCPMHPQIELPELGDCPKCGMVLDPVGASEVEVTEWTCPMHPEVVRDAPTPPEPDAGRCGDELQLGVGHR